jgi:hypothetical protein
LKIRQGWAGIDRVLQNRAYEAPSVEDAHKAFVLTPLAAAPHSLVLENREQQMFDRALAGSGLIVWDVSDETDSGGVRLVPAMGTFNAFRRGTAEDPYPGSKGVTTFDRYNVTFADISAAAPLMRFTVSGIPQPRQRAVRRV